MKNILYGENSKLFPANVCYFWRGQEIGIEGLVFVLPSILDYGPVTVVSLNHKKTSVFNIGSLDMECLFIGYSVAL